MEKDTKDELQSTSDQTRRDFMRTNLGRVVAGAVGLSLVGNAFGTTCHADTPHDNQAPHTNATHADGLGPYGHGDIWGHSDTPHVNVAHGDNPLAHSDATARHNDNITHSNTGHTDYTDSCSHTDVPSHGNSVHSDQLLHVDNCN